MPIRRHRPCAHPSCPALVIEGYCPAHQKAFHRQQIERHGSACAQGYDNRWHNVRNWKIKHDPLCECGWFDFKTGELRSRKEPIMPSCGRLAELVHHNLPVKDFPDRRLVVGNLYSLTRECHDKIETARGNRGQRNA